jgi:hypothetical protein
MPNENQPGKGNSSNGNRNGNDVPGVPQAYSLRLPECFVMMSQDGPDKTGTFREGSVGMKYGTEKSDWLWMPYMSVKKLIDFCTEHKDLFNAQLEKERSRLQVQNL